MSVTYNVWKKKNCTKKKQSTAYTRKCANVLRPQQVEYTTFCSAPKQI